MLSSGTETSPLNWNETATSRDASAKAARLDRCQQGLFVLQKKQNPTKPGLCLETRKSLQPRGLLVSEVDSQSFLIPISLK